ncbi:ABC transporter permease [Spongisporangium articulatum]|uniref:ABC transporter permease n=1 Tax=Spongisporangium articulatum TaxID=3362603 RepID=A0ABW8AI67_9ACTN
MDDLTGVGHLLRLAARRDRVMLAVWLVAIVGTMAATVNSYQGLYPTTDDLRAVAAEVTGSPSLIAVSGPPFNLLSIGGLAAWKVGAFLAVLAAVLNVLLVVRHTRAEEESGRLEVLRASVVGRDAALAAALTLTVVVDGLIVGLVALACGGLGLAWSGAFALGLATGLTGLLFAGVAAVTAQVARVGRTADAIAFSVLTVAFVLRAVGDSSGPVALSWLSPIGWAQRVRPFAGERWWVLLLPLAGAVLLSAGAFALGRRRDFGEALLSDRDGPAAGTLDSPLELWWRLQRVTAVIWLVAYAATGLLFGTIVPGLDDMVSGNANLTDVLTRLGGAQGIIDAFIGVLIRMGGLLAAIYAVQAVLHVRAEETGGTAEPVLTTGTGRLRWAGAQLSLALLISTALLVLFGLGVGVGQWLADPSGADVHTVVDPTAGAILQLPAVWVVGGVALLLFGLLPRLTPVAWGVLGLVLGISWLGPLLELDQSLLDLSPFTHVPTIPGGPMRWAPELWLVALAIGLAVAGLTGWRRRDLSP